MPPPLEDILPLLPQNGHVIAIAAQDTGFKLDPRRQAPLVKQSSLSNDGEGQLHGRFVQEHQVNPASVHQPARVVAQTIAQFGRGALDQHAKVVVAQGTDCATDLRSKEVRQADLWITSQIIAQGFKLVHCPLTIVACETKKIRYQLCVE
jgi:hypothetical protein